MTRSIMCKLIFFIVVENRRRATTKAIRFCMGLSTNHCFQRADKAIILHSVKNQQTKRSPKTLFIGLLGDRWFARTPWMYQALLLESMED